MTILATDILLLLNKVQALGATYNINQNDDGFIVEIRYNWWDDNEWYSNKLFITNESESTWQEGDYEFSNMMTIVDEKLEEQRQKEEKAQKRKELINSLTPEQRELLGV
jgi:hypothetical protein